ncbi:MAG: OmpA family protein [Alcanivoracaceae bacterium]|nr:OmpA family protein [Alcanivoracaceae bacterium]
MQQAIRRLRDVASQSGNSPDWVFARACVVLSSLRSGLRALWMFALIPLLLMSWATAAQAAYLIQNTNPAELSWSGAAANVRADIVVTRYEKISLYRYANAGATRSLNVFSGNFANTDSLSGTTPTLSAPLPQPLDANGNPIALNQPVGLVEANSGAFGSANTLSQNEPLFIVVDKPLLPASAFGLRPDGRSFMAVTVNITSGASSTPYIVTLVETTAGSGVYAGYFAPSAITPINSGDTIDIVYDNYGDINDSNTQNAPSFLTPPIFNAFAAAKTATASAAPPVTPGTPGLFISKEAVRSVVSVGDIAPYRVTVTNGGALQSNVRIIDTLPKGFRLRTDSVKRNGKKLTTKISSDGQIATIEIGDMGIDEVAMLSYVVEVTPIAEVGVATNSATARGDTNTSNEATADIIVENAFFNDRAFLMGRVMVGECGDREAPGLAGVRLYLEDGTNVITDAKGRWHLEGVQPGTHVLQVDKDSFSRRYSLKLCEDNSRKAGNEKSRFIDVQGGTLWREDYWLEAKPEVNALLQQQMITELHDGVAHMRLPVANGQTEFRNVEARLFLPDNLKPIAGTARINGEPISDGKKVENYWSFPLNSKGDYWQQELELDLVVDKSSVDAGFQSILVKTTGTTARGEKHTLISMNQVKIDAAEIRTEEMTLRPSFGSLSAELDAEDKAMLDGVAETIRGSLEVKLFVTGHSDNIPFKRNTDAKYKSNRELSLMRAYTVAEYLRRKLDLPADEIKIEGAGADFPIADNDTEAGRALNRRVELMIIHYEKLTDAKLAVTEGNSGLNTTDEKQKAAAAADKAGFSNLKDGMKVSLPVLTVNTTLDSKLKPKLLINGEEVSAERIGMTMKDPATGLTHYTWVGIDLKQTGDYVFEILGYGPFGNARYKDSVTVTRTAGIKDVRVVDTSGNVADGKTPVRIKLELTDDFGRKIESRTDLRLTTGQLRPLLPKGQQDPLNIKSKIVQVDSEGYAWFEPVSNAGTFRIRLASDQFESDELEVSVDPYLRDWILVGFAEGSVGYNAIDKNIEAMPDAEKDVYTDGEASFYARGRVKGEWLMTVAYDSRREEGDNPHGQIFDPEAWYVLYGDDTSRLHDAPSQEKLYLRMERKDFYVLFGDFQTDLTVTELSRYQRALTGLKSEYSGKNISSNIFAAETGNGFIRDDIPGDGTSGLYQFTRQNILPGTEQISIEVRDRFNNEVISTETRTRFIDYSIDYRTGTVFFKSPVPVQDAQFNPVYIVADYEVVAGEDNVTGGGRVAFHNEDKTLELGISAVHEGTEGARGDLSGADLTWKANERHTIKAEGAYTEQQVSATGDIEDKAWLLEHEYLSEKFDSRLRVEQKDGGFGLGQQAANTDDTRQSSAQGRYRFTETLSANGELRRQEVLTTDNTRDSAEATLKYDQEDWRVYGGLRSATDKVGDSHYESDQVIAGAERDLMDDRLRLSAKGESSVTGEEANSDYPKRLTLGADYRVNKIASVYTNQEMAWGYKRRSQETRTGVRATPWSGGTVTTEVGRAEDEYGPRLFSHAGLYQTMQLNSQWSADLGFDRAQTLRDDTIPAPTFDDRRPLASGTESLDYTAAAAGLGYRDGEWSLTNRVEFRHADTDDKLTLLSGFQHRLDNVNTIAGRFYYYDRDLAGGNEEWESQLDFSFVHRPLSGDWSVLNRTQFILDGLKDASGAIRGRRFVNNTAANYKPSEKQQLALNYGARYVMETIDASRYSGYTDLIGAEYRYNVTTRWDIGARGSVLHGWQSDVMNYSTGVMLGYSPVKDIWLSLGYNFKGFYDADFTGAESRVAGFVLDFRIKFDQDSFKAKN